MSWVIAGLVILSLVALFIKICTTPCEPDCPECAIRRSREGGNLTSAAASEALEQELAELLYTTRDYTWQIQARRVTELLKGRV